MKKILVAGAGLGGLAVAARLARAGHAVEVWEKNDAPGGKVKERRDAGFRWDLGPSLLTMPDVLRQLFADCGERLEDHLELAPLRSACRYFWTDGTVIDEDEAFWRRSDTTRFLAYARGIYELSGEAFLNRPPAQFWRAFVPRHWPKLRHLGKVATTRTLAEEVARRFADPHLRQIFCRFATYNGSSPYRTPATFNIIPYVEARFGPWYVRGGMARLAEAVAALAQRQGATLRYGAEVTRWTGGTAGAKNGMEGRFDRLICNADALTARTGWLKTPEAGALLRPALSTSGFILLLGVRGRDPRLTHHNIFFSDDYPREFAEIHEEHRAPAEPTIYVSISARSDPDHAPAESDNYFVLVNVPARDPAQPWTPAETRIYRDLVLKRLARFGLAELESRILSEHAFTPTDFATRDLAHHGALYGWASHSIRTSLFRPALHSRARPDTYFVGGTTHPGGGIPLVLLSGQMVARMIAEENS